MSPEVLIALMFVTLLAGILAGGQVAFVIGGVAVIFGFIGWGPQAFPLFVQRTHMVMTNYVLCAVPLFVFMGYILEKAGIAEDVFRAGDLYFRRIRGGLAIATALSCSILGVCTGIVATSVITAGVLTMPPMFRRGYNKEMVMGTIVAGGTLGILIPPSIMLIFYAAESGLSAGNLFAAAFAPGFMLSGLYALYIFVLCHIRPEMAPMAKPEKIPVMSYILALRGALPVIFLILAVLGVIVLGVATPTEASGTGALAAILIAAAYRKLSWQLIKEACLASLRTIGMIGLIIITSICFASVFLGMGGKQIVADLLLGSGLPPLGILMVMLFFVFLLGMFIDWAGILYIVLPTYLFISQELGLDPLWFALLICICLQTGWLSPPFGEGLFFLKGITPPEITMGQIIRGCLPFVGLQLIGLFLCVAFPQIILWLPGLIGPG